MSIYMYLGQYAKTFDRRSTPMLWQHLPNIKTTDLPKRKLFDTKWQCKCSGWYNNWRASHSTVTAPHVKYQFYLPICFDLSLTLQDYKKRFWQGKADNIFN